MLSGWFCRNSNRLPNEQTTSNGNESSGEENVNEEENKDFNNEYQNLKKKLKFLLYENEFFQNNLVNSQKKLLKISRDRTFLLERLLHYERVDSSTEESDSSDDEMNNKSDHNKRKKTELGSIGIGMKNINQPKRKKPVPVKKHNLMQNNIHIIGQPNQVYDEGLTVEEVERHLQSRQSLLELVPERAATVPVEMFSNDPSLDSELGTNED